LRTPQAQGPDFTDTLSLPAFPASIQYKFGARSGAAPILLGLIKAGLALMFGSSLLALLQLFPGPLLGAMLLLSGLELAAAAGKERDPRGVGFMLLTAAAIMGLGDTALGFLVGLAGCAAVAGYDMAVEVLCQLRARWQKRALLRKQAQCFDV
jgi:MFS superfamily sulfate permease-like transporter